MKGSAVGVGVCYGQRRPWSYKSIPNLAVWLAPGKVTVSSGVSIASWNDQSGSGLHAVQNTVANQPTLVASGINNKPTVRLDGVDDFFAWSGFPTTWTAATMFLVVKANNDPGVAGKFGLYWFGSAVNNSLYPNSDSIIYDDFGATVRKTTVNPTPALTTAHVYSVRTGPTEWTNKLDGAQLFTTATNTVGFGASPRLGKDAVADVFDGDMGELLIYSRLLAAAEEAKVLASLKAYWGTP